MSVIVLIENVRMERRGKSTSRIYFYEAKPYFRMDDALKDVQKNRLNVVGYFHVNDNVFNRAHKLVGSYTTSKNGNGKRLTKDERTELKSDLELMLRPFARWGIGSGHIDDSTVYSNPKLLSEKENILRQYARRFYSKPRVSKSKITI